MNYYKTFYSVLLFFGLPFLSIAQTSGTQISNTPLQIWKSYQYLLPQTNTYKTTNTTKRIRATAEYDFGVYIDSFEVTKGLDGGYSRLDAKDISIFPYLQPLAGILDDVFNPDRYHIDFEEALLYKDDFLHPDSIFRTINSDKAVTFSKILTYQNATMDYALDEAEYTYDAQKRITRLINYKDDFAGGKDSINYYITYPSGGSYILINKSEFNSGFLVRLKDSVNIANGLISSIYQSLDDTLISHANYTYTAGALTQIEGFQNGALSYLLSITPRAGSDFPNFFSETTYSVGYKDSVASTYSFDANSVLENVVSKVYTTFDTATIYTDVVTDLDGDIIVVHTFDTVGSKDKEYLIYYEFPDGIQKTNLNSSLKVFPIPSENFVTLSSDDIFDRYTLYDLSGKILESKQFNQTKNQNIDIGNYSSGIYYLEVSDGNKSQTVAIERK